MRKQVLRELQSASEATFQNKVTVVLKEYYKNKSRNYNGTSQSGGDGGVDGFVIEDGIIFQIDGSTRGGVTSNKNKFEKDLKKVIKSVIINNQWGGVIKEFVFIVKTIDKELPNEFLGRGTFVKEIIEKVKEENIEYSDKLNFKVEFLNEKRIVDMLNDNDLEQICSALDLSAPINISESIGAIYHAICAFKIVEQQGNKKYQRISSESKIEENDLQSFSKTINDGIDSLNWATHMEVYIVSNYEVNTNFHNMVNAVQNIYQKNLNEGLKGQILLKKVISDFEMKIDVKKVNRHDVAKALVYYIFDRCDIF